MSLNRDHRGLPSHDVFGPRVIRVRGPSVTSLEAQIAAGAIDNPTKGNVVDWLWPRDLILESVFACASSGVDVDDAGLELAMYTHTRTPIITDSFQDEFVSARALVGVRRRWFVLGISVSAGDRWRFQFQNVGANPVSGRLYFRVRERRA